MALINKVLVIGGEIAGMSVAIQLRKLGIQVDLVEIDKDWRVYGAGITLSGPTLRAFKEIGSVVGTSVSAIFLFGIALVNVFILGNVYRTFQKVRDGGSYDHQDVEALVGQGGGFAARIFRPLFKLPSRSWHMYPVGFLFGLGFDTATEVAILGLSAAAASKGLSIGSMMVFPVLFTAGMTLVDTTDGILMIGAYGWAFDRPVRKVFYNLTSTAISVIFGPTPARKMLGRP